QLCFEGGSFGFPEHIVLSTPPRIVHLKWLALFQSQITSVPESESLNTMSSEPLTSSYHRKSPTPIETLSLVNSDNMMRSRGWVPSYIGASKPGPHINDGHKLHGGSHVRCMHIGGGHTMTHPHELKVRSSTVPLHHNRLHHHQYL
ncbi:unnamed protein product, partial [Ectocarpus sp. 12 AP-2014]